MQATSKKIELKKALLDNGLKQKDVAVSLNVSTSAVCHYINGNARSKRMDKWFQKNLGVKVENI